VYSEVLSIARSEMQFGVQWIISTDCHYRTCRIYQTSPSHRGIKEGSFDWSSAVLNRRKRALQKRDVTVCMRQGAVHAEIAHDQ
jgi:hypothetical protein